MKLQLMSLMMSVLALATGFTSYAPTAQAAERPNLLIMTEDFDKDSVPRDTRVYNRVFDGIEEELNRTGFAVFNETSVTLDNFAQGRTRRPEAELVDIARSISRPPIDALIMFTIYASANDVKYTTKVRLRVRGRILNVRTGQRLGSFEVIAPDEWTAPPNCNRECILEEMGDFAAAISPDLGNALTQKLSWLMHPDGGRGESGQAKEGAWTLVFEGFTPQDMMRFDEYLVQFTGYKSHRIIYSSSRRQEMWLESSIESARLNRNMNRLLEETGHKGIVQMSGSKVKITKIIMRGESKPPANGDW